MTDQSLMPNVVQFQSIQAFLDALQAREHIRLVNVADQGLVEPARRGAAFVMQPMVRVVATAFDYKTNEILSWDDKWDVGSSTVPVDATAGRGHHNDPTGIRTRDKIIMECQKRSLQVVRDEEWTPEDFVDPPRGFRRWACLKARIVFAPAPHVFVVNNPVVERNCAQKKPARKYFGRASPSLGGFTVGRAAALNPP